MSERPWPEIFDENNFKLDAPDTFSRDLETFQSIRDFYMQYETKATRFKLKYLQDVVDVLRDKGEEVNFHVGGSLSFGMAEEDSDYDLMHLGNPKWYGGSRNRFYGLGYLHGILEKLLKIRGGEGEKVCEEWMNDESMTNVIREDLEEGYETMYDARQSLWRFYNRYHFNRPLDETHQPLIEEVNDLRKTNPKVDIALRESDVPGFEGSFMKYNVRLFEKGIKIPSDILEMELSISKEKYHKIILDGAKGILTEDKTVSFCF